MKDHFIKGECSYVELPPSAIDRLNSRINSTNVRLSQTNNNLNSVSNRVSDITPYEDSKTAYIGDTETTFYKAKDGMITANCITESGLSIPITMELSNNEIKVMFEELTEVATVTVSIK